MDFIERKAPAVIVGLLLVLGAAAAAILITGGGDSTSTSPSSKSARSEGSKASVPDKAAEPVKRPSGRDCQGISETNAEGSCVEDGIRYVVVNRGGVVELPTLRAKLLEIRTAKTITVQGETATADGKFVTIELEVTNLGDSPAEFDEAQEQILLLLDGNIHFEDVDVEKDFMGSSFLQQGVKIQPQGKQIGTVTFDIPASYVPSLWKNGNVNIANFGVDGLPQVQSELGAIRTYQ